MTVSALAGFKSGAVAAGAPTKQATGTFAAGLGPAATDPAATPPAATATAAPPPPPSVAASLVAAMEPSLARLAGSAAAMLSQEVGAESALRSRADDDDDPLAPLQSMIDAVTSLPTRLAQAAGVDATAIQSAAAPDGGSASASGSALVGTGLDEAIARLAGAIDSLTAGGAAQSQVQLGAASPVTLGLDLSSGTSAGIAVSGAPDLMAQLQAAKPQLLATLDGLGLDTNLLSLKFAGNS